MKKKGIKYHYRMCMHGIKNCIKWFPVIWFDRDYKDNYIYVMLLKKIDNKIKYFQSTECESKSDELEEQLTAIRSALIRLIDDEYYGEACALYGIKLELNYNNVGIMKEDIEKVFALERELRQQDVDVIFTDEVSNKMQGWWD